MILYILVCIAVLLLIIILFQMAFAFSDIVGGDKCIQMCHIREQGHDTTFVSTKSSSDHIIFINDFI